MDRAFMGDYCRQLGEELCIPMCFLWFEGDFEGEILKDNTNTNLIVWIRLCGFWGCLETRSVVLVDLYRGDDVGFCSFGVCGFGSVYGAGASVFPEGDGSKVDMVPVP